MDKKYYKIVFGFNEGDYLPITSDELHKAQIISIEGGKASFEAGFFNNRGNDVMRITPDWHRARGWNKGYKMNELDYEDVKHLQESYLKTLNNSRILADYIRKENRYDLLEKTASEAFKNIIKIGNTETKKYLNSVNTDLVNKLSI